MESTMSIRSGLSRVLSEYLAASKQPFTAHPLANFIRTDLKDAVRDQSGAPDHLLFKGSAGQGTWAKGPWIGIFDQLVTDSAQRGYYPVYLFREDMQGVYLSLNQGMTEAKASYSSDAKTALLTRAANFRAALGPQHNQFSHQTIDLAPSSSNNDTAFYEAGNILAVYYSASDLPPEEQLAFDLRTAIDLYEKLLLAEQLEESTAYVEGDEPEGQEYEDGAKLRLHKRIERNKKLVQKVKNERGTTCEACGFNFGKKYGSIGEGFIEAHHLKPIAQLQGAKVPMDPKKDFVVLCPNCHRMIHRSGYAGDVAGFRSEHLNAK
ncbi:MrcB family domain-containing protein [Arenimonas sp.]|uniref:MrcB family domain-containing protein n=1 Tax=Arenimonas sp. TaxID=1872635 RepID=UPI0039E55620